jgi:hypothetical protein
MVHLVKCFREQPNLRSGLKWRLLLAGGLTTKAMFDSEVRALKGERY